MSDLLERLVSQLDPEVGDAVRRHYLELALNGAVFVESRRHPAAVKADARRWRREATNAARPPVSDKVAYYSPRVEVGVALKTRGRGK